MFWEHAGCLQANVYLTALIGAALVTNACHGLHTGRQLQPFRTCREDDPEELLTSDEVQAIYTYTYEMKEIPDTAEAVPQTHLHQIHDHVNRHVSISRARPHMAVTPPPPSLV